MDQSFAVVLPLKKKTRIDPGELITELRLFVEQTGAVVRMDPRMITQAPASRRGLGWLLDPPAEKVLFEVDGVRLRVSTVYAPYYERSRIHRFINPVMWQTGLGEFADHRAHVLIHEAGIEGEEGPDSVYDRAAAVTATASVVARLTQPVGAIWTSARNAVPMQTFHAAMSQLKLNNAPLKFWMRWHIIPPGEMEDACPGLVTAGLAPFIGREILAPPSGVESRVMIDQAFELARRLIDERLSIAKNTSIETEDGEALRVRLRGPGAASDSPVFQIALPQPLGLPSPQMVASQDVAAFAGRPDLAATPLPRLPETTAEDETAPETAAAPRLTLKLGLAGGGRPLVGPVAGLRVPVIDELVPFSAPQVLPLRPSEPEPERTPPGPSRRIRVIPGGRLQAG
ncbi:MAG: hypothetical protein AAGI34_04745 [Pseudomonadota bacterium]